MISVRSVCASWILDVTHKKMTVSLPPTSLFPSLLLSFISLNPLKAYHTHFPAAVRIYMSAFDKTPPTHNYLFHDAWWGHKSPIGIQDVMEISCRYWLAFNTLKLDIRGIEALVISHKILGLKSLNLRIKSGKTETLLWPSRSAENKDASTSFFYCLSFLEWKQKTFVSWRLESYSHSNYKSLKAFFSLSNCNLPTEIVFLRTTVPAYGSYHTGSYDVKFDILEGNVDNAFDILKRVENGMYVGEYCNFTLLCVLSSPI